MLLLYGMLSWVLQTHTTCGKSHTNTSTPMDAIEAQHISMHGNVVYCAVLYSTSSSG